MTAVREAVTTSVEGPTITCVSRGRCVQQGGPFYLRLRPFFLFCKIMATFPLQNVTARDGRKLRHRWFGAILFYDIACFVFFCVFLIIASNQFIKEVHDKEDKYHLIIWLRFTILAAGIRNGIQFFICHLHAHKFPELFCALEDFFQGIAAKDSESRWRVLYSQAIPILRTLMFLITLFVSSFFFFYQFKPNSWLMTSSYVFMNLWKELPMGMFVCICAHMRPHFDLIAKNLRKVRVPVEALEADEEARRLENARLRYAALTNIVDLLQKCFGAQLAFNLLFFLLDSILQLFIFFVFTGAENLFLLTLSVYYFVALCGGIIYTDRFERKTEAIINELNAFELETKSDKSKYQVQLFSSQILLRPIRISAAGFCVINNALIPGIFCAIATYLIVMINFSPYIVEWANSTIPKHHMSHHC